MGGLWPRNPGGRRGGAAGADAGRPLEQFQDAGAYTERQAAGRAVGQVLPGERGQCRKDLLAASRLLDKTHITLTAG